MFKSAPISNLAQVADASLSSLPPAGLLVVGAVLIGGLLMWAFGGRLVKPMYGFLFGVAGAVAGLFLPASVGLAVNPYLGIGLGAVTGALAGILVFRLSMAAALGVAGGVLAPTVAGAVLWLNPAASAQTGAPLAGEDLFLPGVPVEEAAGEGVGPLDSFFATDGAGADDGRDPAIDEAAQAAAALARSAAERLRSFGAELAGEARTAWDNLPGEQRLVLAIAGALGALAGFLLGLSFPKKVAAVGSAFLGAGVWVPVAARVIHDFSLPGAGALPGTARGWLAVWLIVAAAGLALQWTVLKPKADTPARAE
ncbi:MAG: hypothetical protein D6693_08575 [Planctomycetota bacterium]|nr:MAG: hypothetical protein D6693_08575 [Planctomycetota bacterium]